MTSLWVMSKHQSYHTQAEIVTDNIMESILTFIIVRIKFSVYPKAQVLLEDKSCTAISQEGIYCSYCFI